MFTEDITAIVVDPGSLTIRAGYSGEDTPRYVIPSQVGYRESSTAAASQTMVSEENHQEGVAGGELAKSQEYFIGENELKMRRDHMEVKSAYQNGEVKDWDAFENLLLNVYQNQIRVNPEDYCLLMIPNLFIVKSGVLSSFASGCATSVVLDTGAYSTYAVPVHDGYVLQKSVVKFDIGGEFLTERIHNYLTKEKNTRIYPRYSLQFAKEVPKKVEKYLEFPDTHATFERFCELEIARDLKESVCRVDYRGLTQGELQLDGSGYELPDGNIVRFDTTRFQYSEFFFSPYNTLQTDEEMERNNPELLKFKGMHHMVLEAINACDIDIKRQLFNNIILTGGNSLLSGFSSRLQNILGETAPPNSKIKMIAYPGTTERKFSSWIGGSILASLGSFQSLWIGKQEYQENGESIVEKKCP